MAIQTLSSTTDTAEQIQAALAPRTPPPAAEATPAPAADAPPAPKTEEPPAPAAADPAPAPAATSDADGETDDEASAAARQLAGRRSKLQDRIDKLTKDKYEIARDRDATKSELAAKQKEIDRLTAQLQSMGGKVEPAADDPAPEPAAAAPVEIEEEAATPRPKLDDFESVEDHAEAVARWVAEDNARIARNTAKKEAATKEAADREAASRKAYEDFQAQFVAKRDEARKEYPEWDEVMQSDAVRIPVPAELQGVIMQSELAGHLLFHFGKHPGDLEDIIQSGPVQGLRKLFKLEESIAEARKGKASGAPAAPATPVTPPVSVSDAPPPVSTVGGGGAATGAKSLGEMDYQEFKRARAAGRTR